MKVYLRFKAWCTSQVERLRSPKGQWWAALVLWVISLGAWLVLSVISVCTATPEPTIAFYAGGVVGFLWFVAVLVALYAKDRSERASVIQKIMFWHAGLGLIFTGLDLQFGAVYGDSTPVKRDVILNTTFPWLLVAVSGLLLEPVKLLEKQSRQRQES